MSDPRKASSVQGEKIEWRWPPEDSELTGRIPKGMISVIAGKPDQGKGLFAAHVAAEVSRQGENVLYSAAEDSHGLMSKPRLEAAGADLERVHLWRFRVPEMLSELIQHVQKKEIDLIVMDPLASHLSNGISRHSDNIRKVLTPLTDLVESTGASILIVEHALKRVPKSGHPLDCIGGSGSGLSAAARAAYVFGYDPDDGDRRILAQAKLNIDQAVPALAFELDVAEITVKTKEGEEFDVDTPYLLVDEQLEAFDAMRIFESKTKPGTKGRPNDKRAAAAEWLTTYLAENGPTTGKEIIEDAKQYQMSRRTLERASVDMGVLKGGGPKSAWDLPDDVKELMGLPTKPPVKTKQKQTEDDSVADQQATVTDEDLADLLGGQGPAKGPMKGPDDE